MASPGYRDILLIGKTGKGKSTTGNKLVGQQSVRLWKSEALALAVSEAPEEDVVAPVDVPFRDEPIFPQASQDELTIESITSECKLISNEEQMIRVLDTPGFADTKRATKLGLFKANLQTMRWIIRHQQEHELAFYRVLYFLPERGPLEKADRALQEEIKVMVHYFGDTIFHHMIIVATLRPKHSRRGDIFDAEDEEQTAKVFFHAMKAVLKEEGINSDVRCPPVVYISLKDTGERIMANIEKANVEAKTWPILRSDREVHDHTQATATRLAFRDNICAKCAAKIQILDDGQKMVILENEPAIPYTESKCHPMMIPKYSRAEKFFGGILHFATVGIPYLVIDVIKKKKSWPGWLNSDEICPECSGPAGVEGCAKVLQGCEVHLNGGSTKMAVDHSNKLY